MRKEYVDLKQGDRLRVGDIGMRVLSISEDGTAKVRTPRGEYKFRKSRHMVFHKDLIIYNFGNRHHGRRAHVRIDMRDDWEYLHVKNGR